MLMSLSLKEGNRLSNKKDRLSNKKDRLYRIQLAFQGPTTPDFASYRDWLVIKMKIFL